MSHCHPPRLENTTVGIPRLAGSPLKTTAFHAFTTRKRQPLTAGMSQLKFTYLIGETGIRHARPINQETSR